MQTAVPLAVSRRDLSQRRERLWLLGFCLALGVALALLRWHDWREVQQAEEQRLMALASGAERNLGRRLEAVYAALTGVRDDRPQWAQEGVAIGASRRMRALQAAMPGVSHMALLDTRGEVLAASRFDVDTAPLRDTLLQSPARADPRELQVHVVPGLTGGVAASLVFSIGVSDAVGRFDGLVAAVLDPSYFVSVLKPLLYADDMRTLVVHDNGTVLAQSPPWPDRIGTRLASNSLLGRHRASGWPASVQQGWAEVTGSERLAALHDVRPLTAAMSRPLVLAISRDPHAVHDAWRRQSGLFLAAYIVLVTLAVGAVLGQQRRREEQRLSTAAAERQRAAEAERLALALAGADLALWDAQLPGGESTVNQRWFTMLGHAEGEFDPRLANWAERLHPDDHDAVIAARQAHLDGLTPAFEATYRMRHKSGGWIWVLDRGRVVERGADGAARRIVGTHMDISERMQAQEAVRRSEQSLAITLNSIGDAVIATDPGGRVTRMNPAAERLTGWALAEAIGLPLRQVFRIYDAGTREPVPDPVALVLARGEIVGLANGTVLIGRDGSEHQVADSAAPIRGADVNGDVLGVVLVFSDVSEQYRMLQALRDREHQLSAITDALPGPVSRVDREGRYLFANRVYERWFGLAAGTVVGRTQREVLGESRWRSFEPYVQRALAGEVVQYESSVQTEVDGRLHVLATMVPDRDDTGRVCGHFTLVTDITPRKKAEDALRVSERRSRALLAALSSGVVVHGPDTAVLDANIAACTMLGLSLEQMTGKQAVDPAWRFVEEDGTPMVLARYPVNQLASSAQPLRNFIGGVRRPGRERPLWLLCNGFIVSDAEGAVQQLVVTFNDISERKEAEEELRRSEAQLLMAGRMARLGSWQLEPDRQHFALTSETVALLGLDPAAARLGFDAALGLVDAADRDRMREVLQRCLAEGQAFDEEIVVHTNGVDRGLRVLGEAARDSGGRIVALQGAMQDITEQKQAESRLREAQQALEATLRAVPDSLFELDLAGCILDHRSPRNELRLMPDDKLLGRNIGDALPAEAAEVVMAGLEQAHRDGHSTGLQYALQLAGGQHWFELSVSRKAVQPGSTPRFIALARDISERKRADEERRTLERQLREAQKMESIGTLAGGIAHDFNNILAAILGNVALARGDLPEGHAAHNSLDQINRAGQRARSLVQQILAFSRRQPQALTVQPLRPALEEALALLRATLPAGVRVEPRLSSQPMSVRADATQMQQVVMNLCTNAWHALPEGRGSIVVGLELLAALDPQRLLLQRRPGVATLEGLPAGPCAHLWVKDDGIGMDDATRARIFDPFFTTKPVGQGTGLGLSVVHGIVNAHQGTMRVESQPGLGSTFHVYLPLAQQAADEAGGAGGDSAGARGRGQRVLYVDDDEVMVLMVERLLVRAGYRVKALSHAPEALALLIADPHAFDLLVTDYNMPEVSGLDLCREVLALRPELPVIISSGYLTDALRQQAELLGVRALLKKENTLEELPALVHKLLASAAH